MPRPGPAELRSIIAEHIAATAGLDPATIDFDRPVAEYGLSSQDQLALAGHLESLIGEPLPPTITWEAPTISALAGYLSGERPARHDNAMSHDGQVAIIGMGCRFPGGVSDPEGFWSFLMGGGDGVGEVPAQRWAAFDVTQDVTRAAGVLDDVAGFDADFFGISPGEAAAMDPQQRMLLEVACEALENAAIAARTLRGSRTGVFAGISAAEYAHLTTADLNRVDAWTATGSAASVAAGRISYLLDLRGPSISVDTACSSSLVAVHLAAGSLRSGESDLALAGGVNLILSPVITMTFDAGGGTSPDGCCRAFDGAANGMVRGEGCGVVVLKRLADARRDGDRILAVIAGSAVNSDGRSNGLVAPNGEAQRELLRAAYAGAGIDPSRVDYVEAHGTGTPLGDPVEAHALGQVLGAGRPADRPLLIGSVKTNIGHLEAAAGVAGLIKTVLSLSRGQIPPTLHFSSPNPRIPMPELGLSVAASPVSWPGDEWPATAGVSAFGFSGTNAHVVLMAGDGEERQERQRAGRRSFLLTDDSPERVSAQAAKLAGWLAARRPGDDDMARIENTLARRAGRGRSRSVVLASDHRELAGGLAALAAGEPHPRVFSGTEMPPRSGIVFVFSGHGSAWQGMGGVLAETEPAFASALAELEEPIRAASGVSLAAIVRGNSPLGGVEESQPALFGIQVALARLWASHGVEPAAVIGHSVGEVAAAVVCGALTVEDGARVIACRSRLLSRIAGHGAMALIGLPERGVEDLAADLDDVHVAVVSSPVQTVITGDRDQVGEAVRRATARGAAARVLPTDGAGHSPRVEPLAADLAAQLAGIDPRPPRIAFYSTVLDEKRLCLDAAYWAANLRRPVRLAASAESAARDGFRAFAEISPHPLLVRALTETLIHNDGGDSYLITGTLRRDADEAFDSARATLTAAGLAPVATGGREGIIDLPPAPWQHRRYWAEPVSRWRTPGHPFLGIHVELPGEHRHVWRAVVPREELAGLATSARGAGIFPLSAAAEMAVTAACQAWDASPGEIVIRDLRLPRLYPLTEQMDLTTTLDERAVLRIHGRNAAGAWVEVAVGEVAMAEPQPGAMLSPWGEIEVPGTRRVQVLDRCLAAARIGSEEVPVRLGELRADGDAARGGTCRLYREAVDETATVDLRLDAMRVRGVILERIPDAAIPVPFEDKLLRLEWQRRDLPGAVPDPELERALRDRIGVYDAGEAGVVFLAPPAPVHEAAARETVLAISQLAGSLGGARRLWIVTAGATGPGPVDPGLAALRGLVRVLAFEHPGLRATLADLDPAAGVPARASALAAELAAGRPEDEVAWRDGQRLVRVVTRPASQARKRKPVRPGGAFIVTGGYGTVGLAVTRWLADSGARRVVLGGRAGPSADARVVMEVISSQGTEVVVERGDIAEPGTAERLVAAARAGGTPLCGVVHAAGVQADALADDLTADDLDAMWTPKVTGAWRLHEATEGIALDWFVLCSSAAALLGSPGQAGYATANAWLDGFAAWRRAAGLPATSIAWGLWAGGGQSLQGIDPMSAAEGVEALEAVLAEDHQAIGVVRIDAARAASAYPEIAGVPLLAGLLGPGSAEPAVPATTSELIRERILARAGAVLGIGRDRLAPGLPLTDAGLDSLAAVRVANLLERDLGRKVDPASLLGGVTPDELAAALAGGELATAGTERPAVPPRDAVERQVCRIVAEVSGADAPGVTDTLPGGMRAEVAARLAAETGLRLEGLPADLTIASVADVIRDAEEKAAAVLVRELRADGSHPPLILAHPAGTTCGVYGMLAGLLEVSRPVIGLERIPGEVPDRARRYAETILERYPEGGWTLGGWSFGGVLAYETARQLAEAGFPPDKVVLLDAALPLPVEPGEEGAALARRFAAFARYLTRTYGRPVALTEDELLGLDEGSQLALVRDRMAAAGLTAELSPSILRHQQTSHEDTRALERYRAAPYDGPVIVYRATGQAPWAVRDPRYEIDSDSGGWDRLCRRLMVVPVDAHHLNLLDPPAVEYIAAHLRTALTGVLT
jgi:phthiocerol/phenolphthiocerol synthesis type-I polyketide synthase D